MKAVNTSLTTCVPEAAVSTLVTLGGSVAEGVRDQKSLVFRIRKENVTFEVSNLPVNQRHSLRWPCFEEGRAEGEVSFGGEDGRRRRVGGTQGTEGLGHHDAFGGSGRGAEESVGDGAPHLAAAFRAGFHPGGGMGGIWRADLGGTSPPPPSSGTGGGGRVRSIRANAPLPFLCADNMKSICDSIEASQHRRKAP